MLLVVSDGRDPQAAPEELEAVRELLNTWRIPNDTRIPTDDFSSFASAHRLSKRDAAAVKDLRDDLRRIIVGDAGAEILDRYLRIHDVRPTLADDALDFVHAAGRAGELCAIVLRSGINGTWARVKICPDCRWAFYDHTRSGNKRWCVMNASGPSGRSCGNIAKLRRHRQRIRTDRSDDITKA